MYGNKEIKRHHHLEISLRAKSYKQRRNHHKSLLQNRSTSTSRKKTSTCTIKLVKIFIVKKMKKKIENKMKKKSKTVRGVEENTNITGSIDGVYCKLTQK